MNDDEENKVKLIVGYYEDIEKKIKDDETDIKQEIQSKYAGKKKKSTVEKLIEDTLIQQIDELDELIKTENKVSFKYKLPPPPPPPRRLSVFPEDYSDSKEKDNCRCTKCGLVFDDDDDYEDHSCSLPENNQVVDTIPQNPYGKYLCPICDGKYSTQNLLGEHFILTHSTFDDMSVLDSQIVRYGFPGFDILEYIGMIEYVGEDDMYYMLCMDSVCPICYKLYKIKNDSSDDKEEDNDEPSAPSGYGSDTDVIRQHSINKRKIKLGNHKDLITIKCQELKEICRVFDSLERIPIRFGCCKAIICKDCLESYVSISDTLFCPFCKKDHTRDDLEYIIFIDQTDDIDKSRWLLWWEKHVDIFY